LKKNTIEKFWTKANKTDYCWVWMAAQDKDGYGIWSYDGKFWRAHRFSFWATHGHLDSKSLICHTCDNPTCINPNHLYEGDSTTNNRDTVKRGRFNSPLKRRTHCLKGHAFDGENLYHDGKKRVCKICSRASGRKWYENKNPIVQRKRKGWD